MSDVLASAKVPLEKTPPATVDAAEAAVTPAVSTDAVQPAVVPEAPTAPESTESVDFSEVIKPFSEELATKGELSGDSLKALAEKLGAPLEVVELTYEGMRSRQATRNNEILSVAGGQDAYAEMIGWARTSYSSEDAEKFNAALVSGTKDEALAAIRSLKDRFTAVNGSTKAEKAAATQLPTAPVAPRAPAPAAIVPFASFREQMAAQKDKRYGVDPAYTAEVYKRVALSKF